MKKVKYSKGLAKRAFSSRAIKRNVDSSLLDTHSMPDTFGRIEVEPVKIDNRIIAEQVAASMAIEDRVIPSEDIIVSSTVESRKAVNDVLQIRVHDRQRHWRNGSSGEPTA